MEASISYALDLIIRLIDTTTGNPVTEHQVIFYHDDAQVTYLSKGDGVYVGMNRGRTDRTLRVKVKGYLEETMKLEYEKLGNRYPEVFVNLIPEIPTYGYTDILELSGNMPGIQSIAAASVTETYASAQSYQEKKQQLKIFDSKGLTERAYALMHEEPESFEEFHIFPAGGKHTLRLKEPLQTAVRPEEKVTRIIRGRTTGSGDYTLRVRGDGRQSEYLVRFVVEGKTTFKRIVFDDPEHRRL